MNADQLSGSFLAESQALPKASEMLSKESALSANEATKLSALSSAQRASIHALTVATPAASTCSVPSGGI